MSRSGKYLAVSGGLEAEADIDRSEARPEQQHRLVGMQSFEHTRDPGIFDPPSVATTETFGPGRRGWTGRQDNPVNGHTRPVGEGDLNPRGTRAPT